MYEIEFSKEAVKHVLSMRKSSPQLFRKLEKLLDELREYTKFHVEDEEAYMQKINSPMLEAQKRAHQAFVDKLMSIDLDKLEEIDDNQQEYLHELIEFLGGWLINHILKMDTKIEMTGG